jgi:hypothetical protein
MGFVLWYVVLQRMLCKGNLEIVSGPHEVWKFDIGEKGFCEAEEAS